MTSIDQSPLQQYTAHNIPLKSNLFSERLLTHQRKIRPTQLRSRSIHRNNHILIQNNNMTDDIDHTNNTEALMDQLKSTTTSDNVTAITRTPSSCCNHTPSYRFESRLQHGARQTRLSISFDFLEDIHGRIGKIIGSDYSGHSDKHLDGFSHDTKRNKDLQQGKNDVKAKHQLIHLFQRKTMNSWIDANPRLFGMTVI